VKYVNVYLQFHSVKEPSKNHDIWVRFLMGYLRGRVLFGSWKNLRSDSGSFPSLVPRKRAQLADDGASTSDVHWSRGRRPQFADQRSTKHRHVCPPRPMFFSMNDRPVAGSHPAASSTHVCWSSPSRRRWRCWVALIMGVEPRERGWGSWSVA